MVALCFSRVYRLVALNGSVMNLVLGFSGKPDYSRSEFQPVVLWGVRDSYPKGPPLKIYRKNLLTATRLVL